MRFETIFSGIGGQGSILAGKIAAEAASIYDKKHSVQTVYYGPESRGGVAESFAIIDDVEVDYPKITAADVLVGLHKSAITRHVEDIKDDAIVIFDNYLIDETLVKKGKKYGAPFTKISIELIGRPVAANIVALGMFSAITGKVTKEAMINAISKNVPPKTVEKNIEAFERGFKLGEECVKK